MNVLALTPIAPEVPTGAGPSASVDGDAGEFEALLDRTIRGDGDPSGAPAEDTTDPTGATTDGPTGEAPAGEPVTEAATEAATEPVTEESGEADPTTAQVAPVPGSASPTGPTPTATPSASGGAAPTEAATTADTAGGTTAGTVAGSPSEATDASGSGAEASTTAQNPDGATTAGSDGDASAGQGVVRAPGTAADGAEGTPPTATPTDTPADASSEAVADTGADPTTTVGRSGSSGTGADAQLPGDQPAGDQLADEQLPATREATTQSTGQDAGADALGLEAPTALHRTGAAAAAGTPEGTSLGERLLQMQELVDAAQATLRHRGAERLVVELHPAELGAVTIDLRLDGQSVNVSMRATNSAAVERLLAELAQLRQDLAAAGVDVGDVDVRTGTQGRSPDRDDAARPTGAELRRPASAPSETTATERRHLLGAPIPTNGRLAVDL